jgi:hypothetical protein
MPVFSQPKYNPYITYYTTPQHSEKLSDNEGYHCRNQLDNFVYAKKQTELQSVLQLASGKLPGKMQQEYYIRLSENLKTVYDPRSSYSLPENQADFVSKVCKDSGSGKFIKVNLSIFTKYISFLQNQSENQFKECNRLIMGL